MEGNKEITFSVSESDVKAKIATNSYYRGERMKGDAAQNAAIMQSGEDNNDILNDELDIAERAVSGLISRNLGVCVISKSDNTCNFVVKAASNFPETLKSAVEGAIGNYLHDKVLEGWLLVTMPGEVANLRDRFASDAEELMRLLLERKKPIRTE
jgi:hypothetical protein